MGDEAAFVGDITQHANMIGKARPHVHKQRVDVVTWFASDV